MKKVTVFSFRNCAVELIAGKIQVGAWNAAVDPSTGFMALFCVANYLGWLKKDFWEEIPPAEIRWSRSRSTMYVDGKKTMILCRSGNAEHIELGQSQARGIHELVKKGEFPFLSSDWRAYASLIQFTKTVRFKLEEKELPKVQKKVLDLLTATIAEGAAEDLTFDQIGCAVAGHPSVGFEAFTAAMQAIDWDDIIVDNIKYRVDWYGEVVTWRPVEEVE